MGFKRGKPLNDSLSESIIRSSSPYFPTDARMPEDDVGEELEQTRILDILRTNEGPKLDHKPQNAIE
ncbi:hypothetical protein BG842_05330 [Haladaptatus sp. W1]|uniref:hypothetical protein n=1 Tax=Haladaptatus sp. W1 TaxID=1897478 RepID=UPI000849D90C|nr:hypothetical protein [Haladaptatus sp. W1]ODR81255.1 hypothetical protein BG842_05330 [Haladaptatus sp. W1]